jgi:hypothetical protein
MDRKRKIPLNNIMILFSIVCLLFIRYVEVELDYRVSPLVMYAFVCVREFIAIPGFYFFTACYLVFLFVSYFNINVSLTLQKTIKYFLLFSLLLFAIYSIANVLKIINIFFLAFWSIYALIFSFLGGLFALTIHD